MPSHPSDYYSLPKAPHAPPVHLLTGPGAGPGVWPRHGAGSEHAANPDLHSGGLQPGGRAWSGVSRVPYLWSVSPQPLNLRRLEHEKRRKEIKESWHRAQRKLVPLGWAGKRVGGGRTVGLWHGRMPCCDFPASYVLDGSLPSTLFFSWPPTLTPHPEALPTSGQPPSFFSALYRLSCDSHMAYFTKSLFIVVAAELLLCG